MVEEHYCVILTAAEKISGNTVDCAYKSECNHATACVLVRKHDNWEALTQYFVKIADITAKREEDAIMKSSET